MNVEREAEVSLKGAGTGKESSTTHCSFAAKFSKS